jgi:hypothetical protein
MVLNKVLIISLLIIMAMSERQNFDQFLTKTQDIPQIQNGALTNSTIETGNISSIKGKVLVPDPQNDRVLVGNYQDFTGIKVSRPGFDVKTSSYTGELLFNSDDTDDWADLDPSNFSYNTATAVNGKINVSTYTPSDYFQIGGKIRLVQNNTTKHFYVISVNDTTIDISAGMDNELTNQTITAMAVARTTNPSGFPGIGDYTPQSLKNQSGTTITWTALEGQFSITNNIVIHSFLIDCASIPASTTAIEIETPFFFNDASVSHGTFDSAVVVISTGGLNTALRASYGWDTTSNGEKGYVYIEKFDGSNFSTGALVGDFTLVHKL